MSENDHPQAPGEEAVARDAESLTRRVTELEGEVAAAREEARHNHDRWVRERADLENQRKRQARERQDLARYGAEALVRDLVPALDDLERAIAAARGAGGAPSVVEGLELVAKAIRDVLARHGVERVSAMGGHFDPNVHEAVAHVESDVHPPNAVVEEHRPGYRLHDRLLRPAMVSVSKGRAGTENLANESGGD
jgi:molecular chaperone GrpE